MIILRQKEFARAIPKEALVRELERRGVAGKIRSTLGGGSPKYVSMNFKTVVNPKYVKETEAAWQRMQNQGKSLATGNYKDLGIHQRINHKGTLNYSHAKQGEWISDLSAGGKRARLPKKYSFLNDHPSTLYMTEPSALVASKQNWDFSKSFLH